MTSSRHRLYLRAKARYDRATAKLTPAADGSYDVDEVAAQMAAAVSIDVPSMQMRQARQDLQLLRHDDEDDENSPLQLNLFGEGRLVDYDPMRLVLGGNNRVILHHQAPLEYKVAERDRASENLEHALAKEARKQREVEVFSRWSHEQLALGRLPRELIWGNCVRETGILRGEA